MLQSLSSSRTLVIVLGIVFATDELGIVLGMDDTSLRQQQEAGRTFRDTRAEGREVRACKRAR